ncbi:hypothetical protein [Bradyrhizobium erythrophlei]|uniref:hypothetical protein n=1 Tax=Bradyrhizobium erythrophlei TaxID=1437360 RepID=UPI0012AB9709|nr:hypothetical protein [Bradyrhizobium erythrophlei]
MTNEDHLTRGGTLHYQALKGGQFGPAEPGMKWDHELSGRALCLAGDASKIEADGNARIESIKKKFALRGKGLPSKIKFVAVASATAREVRYNFGNILSDTAFTPNIDDQAHSDLVTYGTSSDNDVDVVRHWLQTKLRITKANNLQVLVSSCGC